MTLQWRRRVQWVLVSMTVWSLGATAEEANPTRQTPADGQTALEAQTPQRSPLPRTARQAVAEGLNPGKRPPDFSAPDLKGRTHTLRGYQNRVVVLHFWATWCPYCRAEIPKLKQIHQRWGSRGLTILAVSVDEHLAQLSQFVQANQLPYPVIAETQSRQPFSERFRVSGIPTTYVIDRRGLVAYRFEGRADLVGAVEQLVGQTER